MARHIHVHFYTGDAGEWKEGDHPRAENGQFGSGGAGAASSSQGSVTLRGNELGPYADMKDLRQKALAYAERFIGKRFKNAATGHEIQVTKTGVKHTLSGSGEGLAKTVPAIPDLLQRSKLVATAPDKRGDPNILAVETYEAPLMLEGKSRRAILTVKSYQDGRRYYDHGLVE
ncbi:hypothetical protein [Herbaspirillum huttiense]|uniref:LPD3 domain-containing protein n=2 Tax=Pseudomonadota TaxID=1224 RepID=UPI001AD1596D|nr:hypothetical protein [Herbaspirillum huttiense]MBN9359820.1 hypothetical protein [Herbaspirillum huttiense]